MRVKVCCGSFRVAVEHKDIAVDTHAVPSIVVVQGKTGDIVLRKVVYCPFCARRIWRFEKEPKTEGIATMITTEIFSIYGEKKEEGKL